MPKIFLKMLDTKKQFGIIMAEKWTFQIVTNSEYFNTVQKSAKIDSPITTVVGNSEYFNTVQKSAKIDSPITTNITDMQFLISKHIPQKFNILTVNKTLKRIERTEKVPRMERNKHKKTKNAENMH